ncbi:hypothetical protein [Peribacillus butanolivorans]|nr:hypothetical protein [Peribacillus butanolivorans]
MSIAKNLNRLSEAQVDMRLAVYRWELENRLNLLVSVAGYKM